MVKKNLCGKPNGAREKAINPSPSGPRPTAHKPHKIKSQPRLANAGTKGNQINIVGGMNRKTLAVDTNE